METFILEVVDIKFYVMCIYHLPSSDVFLLKIYLNNFLGESKSQVLIADDYFEN